MIKVLFNDSCPICSKEINHYKSLDNDINWIDINDLETSMKLSGKSHRELIRRLHVIKDNEIYSGEELLLSCGRIYQNIDGLEILSLCQSFITLE